MKTEAQTSSSEQDVITIKAEQLPLYCPGPNAPLWSMHPRVYIEIGHTGHASCPYCGATYKLDGPAPAGH